MVALQHCLTALEALPDTKMSRYRPYLADSERSLYRAWYATHTVKVLAVNARVEHVEFSRDGQVMLTASTDGMTRIWNTSTGVIQLEIKSHATNSKHIAAFNPDGTVIATASLDKTAHLWDARTGNKIATLGGNVGWVRHVAFSSDGR